MCIAITQSNSLATTSAPLISWKPIYPPTKGKAVSCTAETTTQEREMRGGREGGIHAIKVVKYKETLTPHHR